MKALRLNADYEFELFHNKKAPPILNESVEFLLFFLTDRTIHSTKKYSDDYLSYLESCDICRPKIISAGEFENFWGKNKNIELERTLNSKLTSVQFQEDAVVINNAAELEQIPCDGSFIIKDPFGMSGQNIFRLLSYTDARKFPLLAEKYKNRKYDFSTFKFSDGRIIYYENIVNEKFQYKGTLISKECSLSSLSFYKDIAPAEIKKYQKTIDEVIKFYSSHEEESFFSVDSFVYEENGELKIQAVCEVNYRRTMGSVAYELVKKYSPAGRGKLILLKKEDKPLYIKLGLRSDLMVLSPGDTRFEIILSFTDEISEIDKD